jgi:hypothetical protein
MTGRDRTLDCRKKVSLRKSGRPNTTQLPKGYCANPTNSPNNVLPCSPQKKKKKKKKKGPTHLILPVYMKAQGTMIESKPFLMRKKKALCEYRPTDCMGVREGVVDE